jgi:hypothetical protein
MIGRCWWDGPTKSRQVFCHTFVLLVAKKKKSEAAEESFCMPKAFQIL